MNAYSVTGNDQDLGVYQAESEKHARDLCAQEAGYRDEGDMEDMLDAPSDLAATLMPALECTK